MITDPLKQKRLQELIIPVQSKGELYQKFSFISKKEVSAVINKCISDNREVSIDYAKRQKIIWPKEYEMFLARMKGVL